MPTKLRHYCRHCRTKLTTPEEFERQAFCTKGCYASFYRKRCLVCELAIERNAPNKLLCGRRKCKADYRAFPHLYVYRMGNHPSDAKLDSKTPDFIGSKEAVRADIPPRWYQVAGPKLSGRSFELATLPLEPKFAAHIARQNRAGGAARAIPVNLLGGYRFPDAEPLEPELARYITHIEGRLVGEPLSVVEAPPLVPDDPFEMPAFLRR
jgi:hypothetical protein